MRRAEFFWGVLIILLGLLFFLKAAGLLRGDVLAWFWPILIMAAGLWILLGEFVFTTSYERAEKFSVPLQGAKEASLSIDHGVGQIDLRSGAGPGDFLTGIVGVGMNHSARLNGERLEVQVDAGPSFIPFLGPEGGAWQYRLAPEIPVALQIDAGASRLNLDLSDLRVTNFSFEGGASRVDLTLPSRVENAAVNIDAGAARIDLHVPPGVAIRLRAKSVGSIRIDENRFPRRDGRTYQSADYESAKYRVDINIDGGATSIRVS